MKQYDFTIVGSGLFGATVAYELNKLGYKVLVVERREHIGGNVYTEYRDGIYIHKYGAHIFRTNDCYLWQYINSFVEFNDFVNKPKAVCGGRRYSMPFNMNTFAQVWGVKTVKQAKSILQSQIVVNDNPQNLEEWALSVVGCDIYEMFIKYYTEKQWGVPCSELPVSIMKRIPIRFTYNENYYNCKYQGVPIHGYTVIIDKMLHGVDVICNEDGRNYLDTANTIIYTGCVDELCNYEFGDLGYRSLEFVTEKFNVKSYQNNAVINYTDLSVPYTRSIEHKFFTNVDVPYTYVSFEYPYESTRDSERYYPIETDDNISKYNRYIELSKQLYPHVILAGRLGSYKYTDMEETILNAKKLVWRLRNGIIN